MAPRTFFPTAGKPLSVSASLASTVQKTRPGAVLTPPVSRSSIRLDVTGRARTVPTPVPTRPVEPLDLQGVFVPCPAHPSNRV